MSQLRDNEFEGYPGIDYENGREHLKYRVGSDEFYAIELKESGKVIGNVYFGKRDFEAKEIGYIVNRDYQRKGYALEAINAVIDMAFSEGIHRVFAECDPRNECSWRLLEKAIYLAKQKGVQLLIFPECSLTGYPPRNIINSSSVDFNLVHSLCDKLQSIADKNDISFIVGTIFKEKEIYNRALLFQPNTKNISYDKRALWGWDNDNFTKGNSDGIFEMDGIVFGIRICFEIRFPEFFRELYKKNTDVNVILFYDVSDTDDKERYSMIRGHLQTRAVENVATTILVNTTSPFQTAQTMVFGKSGQCVRECVRNESELLIYDFEKTMNDFGENGRASISDFLLR